MRAMWSGSISFGLVNIPVKLHGATKESTIDFDLLHKDDFSPIHYKKFCEREGKEVPNEEIVRGYEYRKGEYVIITDEDIAAVRPAKSKMIEISEFVAAEEIDPLYFEKPYYIEPDKGMEKPYALLREALRQSGKVAVATFFISSRKRLGIIKTVKDVLILDQIRYVTEITKPDELKIPEAAQPTKKEIDMALMLITQLTKPFEHEEHHDTYVEDLQHLIEAKAAGEIITTRGEEPEPLQIVDLMQLLKASLEKTNKPVAVGAKK